VKRRQRFRWGFLHAPPFVKGPSGFSVGSRVQKNLSIETGTFVVVVVVVIVIALRHPTLSEGVFE